MKKETKIEIFFWLVTLFVFVPRILLEVCEHKLKSSLIPFENNEWVVKDKDGNVIYDKLEVPHDLRWQEQKTNRREWIFEKVVNTENLKKIEDLGIVLGRAGDSDYTTFNDCVIGSTALNMKTKRNEGLGWTVLRAYPIDSQCIKYPTSVISYRVYKWGGSAYGVVGSPFGFSEYGKIKNLKKIINILKYGIQFAFGVGLLFFIGIQYLFIHLTADKREIYNTFGILSIFIGLFLIMTSTYPFEIFSNHLIVVVTIFATAIASAFFFLKFFHQKFNFSNGIFLKSFAAISLSLFLFSVFQKDFDGAYKFYEIWYPVFLIYFFIFFIKIILSKKYNKNEYHEKYLITYAIFLVCCVHDVVVTISGNSSGFLISSAFTFFVVVAALNLSREYSDAFSKVEELVIQRTNQLNAAIADIHLIQKSKDQQARRFAHDIRSPLAALQVLKDVASNQLSEEARGLFKHAVIRINDLANTALPKILGDEKKIGSPVNTFIWPILDRLLSEKRLEYSHLTNVAFELKSKSPVFQLNASCEEVEFTRAVSNLINNAIEARIQDRDLMVTIEVSLNQNKLEIKIQDNGKGIPDSIQGKIFDDGFTHGKSHGKGIGLTHAKQIVENWNGSVRVESEEGKGTSIIIQLMGTEKPSWLATELNFSKINYLVVIDDQPFVVNAWRQKVQDLSKPFQITWVQNRSAWNESEASKLSKTETFYLVDQDLASSVSGLGMIKELKLGPNVVLVTGNDDDLSLRKRAVEAGVTILPKSLIHEITIVI